MSEFIMFGTGHIISIVCLVLSIILLYFFRNSFINHPTFEKIFRYSFVVIYLAFEISLYFWSASIDKPWMDIFPLEICGIGLYLTCIAFIFKKEALFKITFTTGIVGGLIAVIFASPERGFPHYRAFNYIVAHSMLIFAQFYGLWVFKWHVTIKDYWKVMAGLLCLFIVTFILNRIFDANWIYLHHAPDVVGFIEEALGFLYVIPMTIVLMLLYSIPVLIINRKKKKGLSNV